jgi:HlyD family secretion protein
MKSHFKRFVSSPKAIILSVLGISIIAVVWVFASSSYKPSIVYAVAKRQNVVETITAPGVVKAAQSIDLGFVGSGKITSVTVSLGDTVAAGEVLATIDSSTLYSQLEQAEANVKTQQAKLDALTSGTRPEQLAINQSAVASAQTAKNQAEASLATALQTAYVQSDDAVRNKVDQFMSNGRSSNPVLLLSVNNSNLQNSIQTERMQVETLLNAWSAGQISLSAAEADLTSINAFLVDVGTVVNQVTVYNNSTLSQATIDKYKTDITSARSNVSGSLSAVISASTAEQGAQASLTAATGQLTLAQAGATPQDIGAQEAQVEGAQASADAISSELNQTVIRAPIAGVITKEDAQVGAIASPSVSLISMISNSKFQVESFLSEADVAKVKVGDSAAITLDAYQGMSPLQATIIAVDSAASMSSGSPSYKTEFQFNAEDARIKAGLTANADVSAGSQSNALVIPSSAVITKGSSKYVLKKTETGAPLLIEVTVGIEDPSGVAEITSGLQEGDMVASFGYSNTN